MVVDLFLPSELPLLFMPYIQQGECMAWRVWSPVVYGQLNVMFKKLVWDDSREKQFYWQEHVWCTCLTCWNQPSEMDHKGRDRNGQAHYSHVITQPSAVRTISRIRLTRVRILVTVSCSQVTGKWQLVWSINPCHLSLRLVLSYCLKDKGR